MGSGGVLIRFAGERMTNGIDDLVPVQLRIGGRYLGSAMAWSSPQHLAPFGAASPFNGLDIPAEVTVSRQILAEPSTNLPTAPGRDWPTARRWSPREQRGKGWIVLFHITASPAWSSLPLSGLYVGHAASGCWRSPPAERRRGCRQLSSLPPLQRWTASAMRAAAGRRAADPRQGFRADTACRAQHPPGLYGPEGSPSALNVATQADFADAVRRHRSSRQAYAGTRAVALEP